MQKIKGKNVIIVKGSIREFNYCGVLRILRRGALHFLPKEEFTFYNERRINEFALSDDRISIRARDKSGLFRVKRIHIRFLECLRLEKLNQVTDESIEYLNRNKILYFEENTQIHKVIQNIIKHIENYRYSLPKKLEINDEEYLNACEFVTKFKTLLIKDAKEEIINNHMKFPLIIKYTDTNNRKRRTYIDLVQMKQEFDTFFNSRVKELIINTNLESIYPCERRLILGNLEIGISKDFAYRISIIQKLKATEPQIL